MDNRYYNYNCPALMNDGRFITSYVRSSTFDQYVRNINNINNSNEYRQYLQNNGYEITNNIKAYLRQNNTCSVEGKCLPLSGPTTPIVPKTNLKEQWYQELTDEDPSQLDFMMNKNENYIPLNLQPTIYPNKLINNLDNTNNDNKSNYLNDEDCVMCGKN